MVVSNNARSQDEGRVPALPLRSAKCVSVQSVLLEVVQAYRISPLLTASLHCTSPLGSVSVYKSLIVGTESLGVDWRNGCPGSCIDMSYSIVAN